eukprot:snap_masked-scaffold_24-processed-gene-4.23-mRNA-1 protein AED:1.00 eAED:1.00 QI:0/-1/0/0/-1/1/1/0/60
MKIDPSPDQEQRKRQNPESDLLCSQSTQKTPLSAYLTTSLPNLSTLSREPQNTLLTWIDQ